MRRLSSICFNSLAYIASIRLYSLDGSVFFICGRLRFISASLSLKCARVALLSGSNVMAAPVTSEAQAVRIMQMVPLQSCAKMSYIHAMCAIVSHSPVQASLQDKCTHNHNHLYRLYHLHMS